jgi:hypothetical protein
MFVFAQDMGTRNWVKIPLASTPLPPFTTAKKTWSKHFAIFFLKYILNLNTYPWKEKNAQIQSLLSQIWGLKTWSRKCFHLQLGPIPRLHLGPPRNNGNLVRSLSDSFFLEKVPIFNTYQQKWKTSKADHISSRYGGSKIQKEIPSVRADDKTPVCTSIR